MSFARTTTIAAAAILFSTSMVLAEGSGATGDTTTGASGAGVPNAVGPSGEGPAVKTQAGATIDTPPTARSNSRAAGQELSNPAASGVSAPKPEQVGRPARQGGP